MSCVSLLAVAGDCEGPKFLGTSAGLGGTNSLVASQPHLRAPTTRTHSTTQTAVHNGWRRKDPVSQHPQCLVAPTSDPSLHSYPKHVWSPAGGWYAQPANWKSNTAIIGAVSVCLVGAIWYAGAQIEHRDRMPEPGRFFPSR